MKNIGKFTLNTTTIVIILAVAIVAYFVYDSQHQPEAYTISGIYVDVDNPTFSGWSIPGRVYAIDTEDIGIVYLTNESLGEPYDLLWTNEPNIQTGTQVRVIGEIWYKEDYGGTMRTLIEYSSIWEIA